MSHPSNEELISDLRRVAKDHPNLRAKDLEQFGKYSRQTYVSRLGTINQIKKLIGVPENKDNFEMRALKEQLVQLDKWSNAKCMGFFRLVRWPGGAKCPNCYESYAVTRIKTQKLSNPECWVYRCRDCAYNFSDVTKSVFHQTNTPIKKWLKILLCIRTDASMTCVHRAALVGVSENTMRERTAMFQESLLMWKLADQLVAILEEEKHSA